MEQAGRAAGEQAATSRSRRPAIPGLGLVRSPRASASSAERPGGVGAPPGGTTASRQELADRRKCRKARPDAVRRTPQQSVERRAGPRHGPVISGDPEIDPLARRVTGVRRFRTSACRRSAPLIFFRERKLTKGIRRPPGNRAAQRWLVDNCRWMHGARMQIISAVSSRTVRRTDPGPIKPGPAINETVGICGSRLSLRSAGMTSQSAMPGTSPGMANSQSCLKGLTRPARAGARRPRCAWA